nr:unnamed protein product [Digitaria exilis]
MHYCSTVVGRDGGKKKTHTCAKTVSGRCAVALSVLPRNPPHRNDHIPAHPAGLDLLSFSLSSSMKRCCVFSSSSLKIDG